MAVEPHYLDTAFGEIKSRFGGLDGYLTQALGVDVDQRRAIEARLLE